jgi:hypothetical protein
MTVFPVSGVRQAHIRLLRTLRPARVAQPAQVYSWKVLRSALNVVLGHSPLLPDGLFAKTATRARLPHRLERKPARAVPQERTIQGRVSIPASPVLVGCFQPPLANHLALLVVLGPTKQALVAHHALHVKRGHINLDPERARV